MAPWFEVFPQVPYQGSRGASNGTGVMAYDEARNRVVFVGANRGTPSGGAATPNRVMVWEMIPTTGEWEQKPTTTGPTMRSDAAMVYDVANGVCVLFGGNRISDGADQQDTWTWDGTDWTALNPVNKPPIRGSHRMAYDRVRNVTVLFGGFAFPSTYLADLWEWDGTNWTQITPGTLPDARSQFGMVFEENLGKVLIFGGDEGLAAMLNDTWTWDGTTAVQLTPATTPTGRAGFHGVYHAGSGDTIWPPSYSDDAGTPNNEVWKFNGSNWSLANAATTGGVPVLSGTLQPSDGLHFAPGCYDRPRQRCTWYGGDDGRQWDIQRRWEWDQTWFDKTDGPQPDRSQVFVYDPVREKAYVHGGWAHDSGVWEFNGETWTARNYGANYSFPGGSVHFGMAYWFDIARDRLVTFGGRVRASETSDTLTHTDNTYEWDPATNTWATFTPATRPSARRFPAFAYDTSRNRCWMFGGIDSGGTLKQDLWYWDGTAWTEVILGATKPSARKTASMAYDASRDIFVLYGGRAAASATQRDTWEYDIDTNTWTNTIVSSPPSFRREHVLVYDPDAELVYLFGGMGSSTPGNADLWHYTGATWTLDEANPSHTFEPVSGPHRRQGCQGIYFTAQQRMMFYGGGIYNTDVDSIASGHSVVAGNSFWSNVEFVPPPDPGVPPPASTGAPGAQGKRLGCGDYRVFLQEYGGGTVLAELAWPQVTFSRRLDEMSDERVEVWAEQDADCLAALASFESWTHEISIWRDGVEEWVGPITEPEFYYDHMVIPARDLFGWLERRLLLTDRTFTNIDVSTIAQVYATDALNQDPTPNLTIAVTPTGILATRSISASLYRRAADEIRELARTGLDFTAIARTIRFGGAEIGTPELPLLTEDIFEINPGRIAGLSQANDVYVLGSSGSGVNSPTVGRAGGLTVPLIQQTYSEPSILDVDSANQAAQTRWDLLHRAPFFVTGRLLEDAPIHFSDLVPGARGSIRQQVGFRMIDMEARLIAVDVTAAATLEGATEDVRLTFEPLGTVV